MKEINNHNLETATALEVFEHVRSHLLNQGVRSQKVFGLASGETICAYRGEVGTKCAAGCLIADDSYSFAMESFGWKAIITQYNFPQKHQRLIRTLQAVHDFVSVSNWKAVLDDILPIITDDSEMSNFQYLIYTEGRQP